MSLTLKKFRELTKDLPGGMTINTTIEFGNPNSIRGTINEVHICKHPHTWSDDEHITLTQYEGENLKVKKLADRNEWEDIE